MARLIDANNLIFTDARDLVPTGGYVTVDDILKAPIVDTEEVVRCKDCVFWGAKKDWIKPNRKCLQLDFETASMFFCGLAERKRGKEDV